MSTNPQLPPAGQTQSVYCRIDEVGELCVEDNAWLSEKVLPPYTLVPEAFKDNTEYAKKVSASNREAMYGSRNLSVLYQGAQRCPYLPIDRVRVLGVPRKGAGTQPYGTNYIRVGVPESIFDDVCRKASQKLDLRDPPVEKITRQGGLCLFTVTVPKSMRVQTLAIENGEESVVEIAEPSKVFTMGTDIMASCFFILKAKYKGHSVAPDQTRGYTLAFEPVSLTLIEPCDGQLDSELTLGAPTLSMASAVPSNVKVNTALTEMLRSLSLV